MTIPPKHISEQQSPFADIEAKLHGLTPRTVPHFGSDDTGVALVEP